MPTPIPANLAWLRTEEASIWLTRLAEESPPSRRLRETLREAVGSQRAALVAQQVELRGRGQTKFSRAERMLFTRRGLEQSTDEAIARFKRQELPDGLSIVDLCCGIGGDLVALGQQNGILGIDRDEGVCHLARHNARAHDLSAETATVHPGDVRDIAIEQFDLVHLDPDRRPGERRQSRVEDYDPPLDWIATLIDRETPLLLKLSPAALLPDEWHPLCRRQWIESRGECRQQVAHFGPFSPLPGRHEAVCVDSQGHPLWRFPGSPGRPREYAGTCLRYLVEPARPVLAANLSGALALEHDLQGLWPSIGYLTGDAPPETPAATAFEVEAILPYDRKKVRAWLRERKIGRVEVKKRATNLEPARIRKELSGSGDGEITLVLAGRKQKVTAILCRRVGSGPANTMRGTKPD